MSANMQFRDLINSLIALEYSLVDFNLIASQCDGNSELRDIYSIIHMMSELNTMLLDQLAYVESGGSVSNPPDICLKQ